MSEVVSRIPFDRGTGKYKADWHQSQEEQVSKDRPIWIEKIKQHLTLRMMTMHFFICFLECL